LFAVLRPLGWTIEAAAYELAQAADGSCLRVPECPRETPESLRARPGRGVAPWTAKLAYGRAVTATVT
jgi:hypothetical protein